MKNKPEFFNIEVKIGDYVFYESTSDQHNRVYVPSSAESFEEFIDVLWSLTANPTEEEKQNYELVKKYPFLFVKNRWDGGIYLYYPKENEYNRWFRHTEVSWLLQLDHDKTIELLDNLVEEFDNHSKDFKYIYTITDIKEKWYTLRWYDNGNTKKGYKLIHEYCQYMDEHNMKPQGIEL